MVADITQELTIIKNNVYGDEVRFAIANALESLNNYSGWAPVKSKYNDENTDFINNVQTPITTKEGHYLTTNIGAFILYKEG